MAVLETLADRLTLDSYLVSTGDKFDDQHALDYVTNAGSRMAESLPGHIGVIDIAEWIFLAYGENISACINEGFGQGTLHKLVKSDFKINDCAVPSLIFMQVMLLRGFDITCHFVGNGSHPNFYILNQNRESIIHMSFTALGAVPEYYDPKYWPLLKGRDKAVQSLGALRNYSDVVKMMHVVKYDPNLSRRQKIELEFSLIDKFKQYFPGKYAPAVAIT